MHQFFIIPDIEDLPASVETTLTSLNLDKIWYQCWPEHGRSSANTNQ